MSRLSKWLRTRGRIPWHEIAGKLSANAPELGTLRTQAANPMEQAYYSHDDLPASKWHHYLEIYDRHFSRFRGKPVRVLEVGVAGGGSLQIWRKYFGEQAVIHGLDIDPKCAAIKSPGIVIHIGGQDDGPLLNKIVGEMGGLDIVIDDGSHQAPHQIKTFETLFPRLAADGVYLCEDVHTAYWRDFGGGLRNPGSFMEYAKRLLDRLHSWYFERTKERTDDRFPYQVRGISFYDSVIVVEKQQKQHPFVRMSGR